MTTGPEFRVDLPTFSGPFKLLADLVMEQRVDVCDVPVARVTEAFLRRGLSGLDRWSLEEATWFVAVCAVVLELKVGRLLPRPVVQTEEDLLGGASPDLVYARSLELAAFRRLSDVLAERMAEAALVVPRTVGPPEEFAHLYPDLLANVGPADLRRAAATLLRPPPPLDLSHVTPIRATLADAIELVQDRKTKKPAPAVVDRFLALLELYREGKVELRQATVFGEIQVRWQGSERDVDGLKKDRSREEAESLEWN